MVRSKPPRLAPLAPLLQKFSRSRVVVVGDFVADEYVYGETERISREAPVLIVRFERSEAAPGGAGNAAQNLASLGVDVRAVGLVGHDALGSKGPGVLRRGSGGRERRPAGARAGHRGQDPHPGRRAIHAPPADAGASTGRPSRCLPRSSAASSPIPCAPRAEPPPCWRATMAPACSPPG